MPIITFYHIDNDNIEEVYWQGSIYFNKTNDRLDIPQLPSYITHYSIRIGESV
jgi:hypothetical protein